jgi:pilus assembly protein CpaF
VTLLERVEAARVPRDDGDALLHEEVPLRLREALFEGMPARSIAEMAVINRARARQEVEATIEIILRSPEFSDVERGSRGGLVRKVADMVLGLGPIEQLIDDETITEIMVNGPDAVFYERGGRLYQVDSTFTDAAQVRAVIDRIVAPLGRRIDEQSPIVNARLPQGHRVNAVVPPLAIDGPVLTIRKFATTSFTLEQLVEMGTLSSTMAQLLSWAVCIRRNIAVSGGTGGGKTTLLNALSDKIPSDERIITIEDSAELRFQRHPHVVRLEARPSNAEGVGLVTIRDLVVNSLRMRPDRIIVGECRSAETLDMLQAMNTGHEGSMTTLHANAAVEVLPRLVMLARYGIDLPIEVIEEQVVSAVHLIVQQDRFPDGSRRVVQIAELRPSRRGSLPVAETVPTGSSGVALLAPLVTWDRQIGRWQWQRVPLWLGRLVEDGLASREEVDAWQREIGCSSPS